jgi:hypothetical protein
MYSRKTKATDQRIVAPYNYKDETRYRVLYNYKEAMFRLKIIKENLQYSPPKTIDFLQLHKINYRTFFKLTNQCEVCRSTYKFQNHHIEKLKYARGKYGTYKGFDKVVASVGRKQITVCGRCHERIHKGEYDGMKLEHIFDLRLIPSEAYIDLSAYGKPTHTKTQKVKIGHEYTIDLIHRTITVDRI